MARRRTKRDDASTDTTARDDDVGAVVRAAARSIADRLAEFPPVDDLAHDDEFLQTSRGLSRGDVRLETVERLARSSNAIVAAIADRALARRESVSEEWLAWGFRRLKHAYAGELFFLLEAIERHSHSPLLARVLANADDDWAWGWCLGVITSFAERRVRAGEEPTAADFDAIDPSDEEDVAKVVAELDGVLPAKTMREFDEWRRRRAERKLFESLGRIWEPSSEPRALTSVGGRAVAVAALDSALRGGSDGSSVLLVGEHGVGKSAVLREVLGPLRRDGWLIFEASATELMAGQGYVGELDTRLREIAERSAGRSSGSCRRSPKRSRPVSTRGVASVRSTSCSRTWKQVRSGWSASSSRAPTNSPCNSDRAWRRRSRRFGWTC